MAFEVMHAERRLVERRREGARDAGADEKSAGEARTSRVGDDVDRRERRSGLPQHLARERQDAPDVVARGELRDDAAVLGSASRPGCGVPARPASALRLAAT
jgi:hypothetical protein